MYQVGVSYGGEGTTISLYIDIRTSTSKLAYTLTLSSRVEKEEERK
jgi:hypothetical protein